MLLRNLDFQVVNVTRLLKCSMFVALSRMNCSQAGEGKEKPTAQCHPIAGADAENYPARTQDTMPVLDELTMPNSRRSPVREPPAEQCRAIARDPGETKSQELSTAAL